MRLYCGCWCHRQKGEVRGALHRAAVQQAGLAGGSSGGQAALPVLQLPCHPLRDPSTHQANQEQYADAPADHRQDVIL